MDFRGMPISAPNSILKLTETSVYNHEFYLKLLDEPNMLNRINSIDMIIYDCVSNNLKSSDLPSIMKILYTCLNSNFLMIKKSLRLLAIVIKVFGEKVAPYIYQMANCLINHMSLPKVHIENIYKLIFYLLRENCLTQKEFLSFLLFGIEEDNKGRSKIEFCENLIYYLDKYPLSLTTIKHHPEYFYIIESLLVNQKFKYHGLMVLLKSLKISSSSKINFGESKIKAFKLSEKIKNNLKRISEAKQSELVDQISSIISSFKDQLSDLESFSDNLLSISEYNSPEKVDSSNPSPNKELSSSIDEEWTLI